MPFWKRNGGWEQHPCHVPDMLDIKRATDDRPSIVVGQVWRCHCGRRWLLKELNQRGPLYEEIILTARGIDWDDVVDGIADIEEYANGGNDAAA